MGQPIELTKGEETMTVYGRHQAAVHVGEGWQPVDSSIDLPLPPAPDATDAAVELAQEHDLNLAAIEGSGENGRILVGDVRKVIDAGPD